MEKFKFVIIVVMMTCAAYIVMLPMWGIITSSAFGAATTVNATADNPYAYRHTIGALQFAPLALFFVPGGIGITLIAWKLKFSRKNDD